MHKKPSPVMEMLLRELEQTKAYIKEIHQKLEDPELFEKISNQNTKKSS